MKEQTPDRLVRATKFRDACGASPKVTPRHGYRAGQVVGTLLEFTSVTRWTGGSGWIETLMIADKSRSLMKLTLVLFGVEPTTSKFADGEACQISDADLIRSVGAIRVDTGDWDPFEDNALATVRNCALGFQCGEASLYGVLVARGDAAFSSESDLYVLLTVEQD